MQFIIPFFAFQLKTTLNNSLIQNTIGRNLQHNAGLQVLDPGANLGPPVCVTKVEFSSGSW